MTLARVPLGCKNTHGHLRRRIAPHWRQGRPEERWRCYDAAARDIQTLWRLAPVRALQGSKVVQQRFCQGHGAASSQVMAPRQLVPSSAASNALRVGNSSRFPLNRQSIQRCARAPCNVRSSLWHRYTQRPRACLISALILRNGLNMGRRSGRVYEFSYLSSCHSA